MIEKIGTLEGLLDSYQRAHTPQVAYEIERELKRVSKHYNSDTFKHYKSKYEHQKDQTPHNP